MLSASLMYIGGMYLNDYCDAEFDAVHRKERPIPAGQVTRSGVLTLCISFLVLGVLLVGWMGPWAAFFALFLVFLIVAYNWVHKKSAWGVPLMAACRLVIYFLVGSVAVVGLGLDGVSAAILMFLYVFGITSLARNESTSGSIPRIGVVALLLPIPLLLILGFESGYWLGAIFGVGLFASWVWWAFWRANIGTRLILGKTIGPLLAGICLLDLAILCCVRPFSASLTGTLLTFFVLALIAQRRIPAT